MLGHQTTPPSSNGVLIDQPGRKTDTARIVEEYDVRTPRSIPMRGPSPAATSRS